VSRQFKLNNTSTQKLEKFLIKLTIPNKDEFSEQFQKIVYNDCKLIKECSEKSIVDFYIIEAKSLLDNLEENYNNKYSEEFWQDLKTLTRTKLANKYTSKNVFDNNIDIYFNDVKREYILHPQNESEELEFIPENKDIFIKNNLKLVIDCAKRYQNLGLPFEDLIQIGNIGLLSAFEKFDTDRANLRFSIIKDIKNFEQEEFSQDDATNIIRKNFTYTKLLDATLKKIPKDGFSSKENFIEWTQTNIKSASFSSVSFAWIRAAIISELSKYSKIVKPPKSNDENESTVSIIRLDSINPHTDDNYYDNQISEIAQEEFLIEDESIEKIERQNLFKELIDKLLFKLNSLDRRVIKKKFGIEYPFPLSISEIAESEGISQSKCKYIITNGLKIIANNIPEQDKKTISEMLQ